MKQALLVIDVQESFRHRPYFSAQGLPDFLANVQALIDRCQARAVPVVQVFHRELPDDAANPFAAASGLVRAMPELSLQPAVACTSRCTPPCSAVPPTARRSRTGCAQRGIGELLITGIRTEQCCETTTRHASDLGFRVRYVTDATLTFPMRTRAGREVSPAEIRSAPRWCSTAASRRSSRPQPALA